MSGRENEQTPMRKRSHAASGGKRYCALCKKYENQILEDGFRVTMHRIPGGKSKEEIARNKAWLRGIKLHRPNVSISSNTRICILHFENRKYIPMESVPKYYNLDKHCDEKPKARRLLLNRNIQSDENVSSDQLSTCNADRCDEESEEEIYYATKVFVGVDTPEVIFDSIDNCEHDIVIKNAEVS